jgi:enoyl-CoA hydratase
MEEMDGDDSVDVVILTGADPAFCAGVDLKEVGSGVNDPTSRDEHDHGRRALTRATR